MPRFARSATTSVRVLAVGALNPISLLDVDHTPERGEDAFVHHLRKRRVREDRLDEIGLDELGSLADRIAMDEFGHSAPIMCAPNSSPVFASKTVFTKPSTSPSAIALPFPIAGFADLHLVAGLLGLFLGEAHSRPAAGNSAARDVLRVGRVRMRVLVQAPSRWLGSGNSLVARLVGQPQRRGDVSDSPIPGTLVQHIGSVSMWPFVVFTPSALETDILGVRRDANRDDAIAKSLLASFRRSS